MAPDARTIYWQPSLRKVASDHDQLRAAAKQVAALTEHPGWTVLCEIVQAKVDALHESMLPPGLKQHAEYIGTACEEYALRRLLEAPDAVRLISEREATAHEAAVQRAARAQEQKA